MMREKTRVNSAYLCITIFIVSCFFMFHADSDGAVKRKVLVVMSYHEGNDWQDRQREGIEAVLSDVDIQYVYLDTRRNMEDGHVKAREAFRVYQEFKPDAVIACDDNAQSLFVVPYLRDKVKTPVIFLGVNNDASKYGFPTGNVTGVIEVKHVREGLSFAQLIDPDIKKVAVIYKDNRSNRLNVKQIKEEQNSYPVEIYGFVGLQTLTGAVEEMKSLEKEVNAIFSLNLTGLTDENGRNLEASVSMARLSRVSRLPIIAADTFDIESGALCGVVKTGQEQGKAAARMVRQLLAGSDIRDIPVTRNKNGLRYINLTTAGRLGILIPPSALLGTRLVH